MNLQTAEQRLKLITLSIHDRMLFIWQFGEELGSEHREGGAVGEGEGKKGAWSVQDAEYMGPSEGICIQGHEYTELSTQS